MLNSGHLPLAADRYTPFVVTLTFTGIDLTDAVMKAQVRDRKDGGTIRADLATVGSIASEGLKLVYADSATVTEHVAAGRGTLEKFAKMGLAAADSVFVSQVSMRINEATMEAMPFGTEIGDDFALWWDMHITLSGGIKEKYLYGSFVVRAGVTQ